MSSPDVPTTRGRPARPGPYVITGILLAIAIRGSAVCARVFGR